ncbi:outer membrane protein assembly factor BamD [Companilactobacillus jidongensis]|uniref:hypothetical protein n=1 Tax=Companilactobacillus jidongensis TaxID=2486006 RepID=UPI000F777B56|nr:hypothetical protein [Companilactobacillus jidongensis]
MKKALALLATTFVGILLVGCSNGSSSASSSSSNNNNDYKTEMSKGNKAVNKKDYETAADHFESANEAKNTKKSKASKIQADKLSDAIEDMKNREFSDAKKALTTAKNQTDGNDKMTSHSKKLLSQVKTIIRRRSDYNTNIKTAKELIKANNNDQARALLEQVTKADGIKGKYYSDIYKKAKKLLDGLPASSVTAENNTTDSNSSNNSTTSSNDSSSSSSSDDSSNPAAKGDFDVESKEVDGKTITDSDISKARQDLTDQGVKNVAAWSDNDIVRAIKNAAADGRSTIKASDAQVK